MYKIKDIKLTNFKFFFGDKHISLNRKHALIYGENGSGKSSIYWALHCFLHSTLKPDIDSAQKYFKHITEHDESIRNRYAGKEKNSGVVVKLSHDDNRLYADIDAEVSNTTLNTQTNHEIKLMTLSSELINYKVIYNMYLATNRDSIKLFKYFRDNLMEFIDFDQELTTIKGKKLNRNSLEWWRYLKEGIDPYPGIGGTGYWEFKSHVDLFNQKFSDFLQLITEDTNKSLSEDFNEEFKIRFKYTPATYNEFNTYNRGRNKTTTAPEIELIVELPNLPGKAAIVERPQSYLNEARLSSIAIAIRFSILKERYIEQAPKVMVLDDLLLSLDLGNRSALLSMLLKKYSSLYQLILLTHDRVFFDCVLNHLSEEERTTKWKIFEMYETEEGEKRVPSIVEYQTPLSKAYAYFKGKNCPIDYNACGNNQRQALEEIFKKQFNTYCLKDEQNCLVNTKDLMLGGCIAYAKKIYPLINYNIEILNELNIHIKQSLNPSSHHNPKSNFYKRELQRTFEIIEILKKHYIKVLIETDSVLTFKILCKDSSEYNYKVIILDNILIYKKPNSDYYFIPDDRYNYQMVECDGKPLDHKINSRSLIDLYNETINGIKTNLHKDPIVEGDVYSVFNRDSKRLIELLNTVL